jgi:hypothetical protein
MIRNKKFFYILAAGLFLVGTGCKKYLDVNKNLNSPTAVPVSTLLTNVELSIGNAMAMGSGLSSGLSVYMHQACTRGNADGYGIKGDNGAVENPWYGFYGAITDLDVIISQGTSEKRFVYAGIAKILKAYSFSIMVDMWGDIPFSEFNQFKNGVKQPKFDDDAAIYPQLFTLIDAGIADINNTTPNPTLPGSDDVIYAGSKAKWIKAANTIKLKMYTQVRRVQNVTAQVTALLATPANLINATNESFLLPYGPLGSSDDRNPGFGDYTASQRGQNVSPWVYEIMKGISAPAPTTYTSVFNGIADPRMPYYIYNQLAVVSPATPPNATEYRDGPFCTLYFGSLGPNRNGAQQNAYSMFGIYPVGGRYDDGLGSPGSAGATSASGTGAAPYRFLTYADRLFLEAELINTGVMPGGDAGARTVLSAAMTAAMAQVDYVITTYVKPSQTVPALVGAATTAYINAILAKYDASTTTAKKLEYIMTQKWLSSFGCNVDQYTDYRRTGYPVLFDPRDATMAPGGRAQPPLTGNPLLNPQASVPVALSKNFPESLPWSQSEKEVNGNAPAQKIPENYKIFWKP